MGKRIGSFAEYLQRIRCALSTPRRGYQLAKRTWTAGPDSQIQAGISLLDRTGYVKKSADSPTRAMQSARNSQTGIHDGGSGIRGFEIFSPYQMYRDLCTVS